MLWPKWWIHKTIFWRNFFQVSIWRLIRTHFEWLSVCVIIVNSSWVILKMDAITCVFTNPKIEFLRQRRCQIFFILKINYIGWQSEVITSQILVMVQKVDSSFESREPSSTRYRTPQNTFLGEKLNWSI